MMMTHDVEGGRISMKCTRFFISTGLAVLRCGGESFKTQCIQLIAVASIAIAIH